MAEPAISFFSSRLNAILLLACAIGVSPAFSADTPSSTTTRARIVGSPQPGNAPQPSALPDDIDPATGFSRSTVVRPLGGVPPPPAAQGQQRAEGQQLAPLPPSSIMAGRPRLALILPTDSPTLGRLAEAVRQGFAAASEVAGKDAPLTSVIAVDNEGAALLEACRQAQASGALMVIGGLTRDGATALARSDCARTPTLALNEPQGFTSATLPRNLFTVSLSTEQEARQVALMAVADGRRSAIVIASRSPLAHRVEEAFGQEWARAAGEIHRIEFNGGLDEAPLLRERVAAAGGDMVFLALEAADARAVRPYISATLPLYGTSLSVNPRAEPVVNLDLQGLRYVEMPWFVQPDHPAVMVYPQPSSPMSVEQERLYAFGIDVFRLALHMLRGEARRSPLDGVTGRLSLEGGNTFVRTLTPVEVDDGHVVPLRSR